MKYFDWSEKKNTQLIRERGVSFEDVLIIINEGGLLAVLKHPNQKKYPKQKIFVININNYAFLVPFVEDKEKIFIKTIIPSRKATKNYLIK